MMAAADSANEARLAAAAKAKADAAAKAAADAQAVEDKYYTKVLASGKTQAQIDALRNAYDTAELIRTTDPTKNSTVDRVTGKVVTTTKEVTPTPIVPISSKGGKTFTASDGTVFTDEAAYATYQASLNAAASNKAIMDKSSADTLAAKTAADLRDRQSAYDLLYNEFNKYGLGSLVDGIKGLIQSNVNPSQFAIELQNTDAYKKRFAANQNRISAGLKALSPAEYIGLEDQYQNIMRNYGLPASYYSKDSMGTQVGFEKFLANDVSASELEDRIATAQQRVINSNPEVLQALKQFYPDISNADILSYALDPSQALTNIKRKVTAAEIGGAALAQGLQASGGTAESLAGLGITKAQAQQGYTDIAGILPRGSQLADIYGQQPYTQGTAEAEVFNTAGAADAAARRKKLSSLETAQFSGSSGVGALGRDKALYGAMQGQQGLY
jgi:uncharacterized membrane protein